MDTWLWFQKMEVVIKEHWELKLKYFKVDIKEKRVYDNYAADAETKKDMKNSHVKN